MRGVFAMQGFDKVLKMMGIDAEKVKTDTYEWFGRLDARFTAIETRLTALEGETTPETGTIPETQPDKAA
jgi:hypothetical protein